MKRSLIQIGIAFGLFYGAMNGRAQQPAKTEQPAAAGTISTLAHSAETELANSTKELAALRERIAAEKLPLAQQLTAAEEKLTQLRREHEKVTRLVDAGKLGIINMKSEIKARQDELTYIGNLLDEYARSFENQIHVSERQKVGKAIESAKQATENTALTMPEKFRRQTDFVGVSLARIDDAIGGMRFDGVGVDLQGSVLDGQYAIVGPVALFRSRTGETAGLALPQTGSPNPLIRPLEGELQTGLSALLEHGEGSMPLDPSRGGALKALVQKTDPVRIFKNGGPIMYPLLLAACLALLTVFERVAFLLNERRKRDLRALDRFFAAVGKGQTKNAILIGRKTKYFLVRALCYALEHKEKSLSNALLYSQEQELKRFRRGIPILDTIITLAPLLGLLGTVTGMMGSFSLIGGELSSPGAITGGIAEALIATAFGLGIAITSLIPFNYLNTKMEEARIEIETAASRLELLVQPAEAAADPTDEEEWATAEN